MVKLHDDRQVTTICFCLFKRNYYVLWMLSANAPEKTCETFENIVLRDPYTYKTQFKSVSLRTKWIKLDFAGYERRPYKISFQ